MLRKIRMDREDDIDALFRIMNRTDAHYYEFSDDGSADLRISGPDHPVNQKIRDDVQLDSFKQSASLIRTEGAVFSRASRQPTEGAVESPPPTQPLHLIASRPQVTPLQQPSGQPAAAKLAPFSIATKSIPAAAKAAEAQSAPQAQPVATNTAPDLRARSLHDVLSSLANPSDSDIAPTKPQQTKAA